MSQVYRLLLVALTFLVPICAHTEDMAQGPSMRVRALGCTLQIPISYTADVGSDRIEFYGSDQERLTIWKLTPEWPSKTESILLNTRAEGPLTVQQYEYTSDGQHHPNAVKFTVVRGRDQQLTLYGMPAADIVGHIAQCMRTMKPELVASASRRAQGCTAQIRLVEALERIQGKDQPEPPTIVSQGSIVGWRIEKSDPTGALARAGMQGGLLTSVCGISAAEILADRDHICCDTTTSHSIPATFRAADGTAKTIDLPTPSQ